jgi:hypothetical protein
MFTRHVKLASGFEALVQVVKHLIRYGGCNMHVKRHNATDYVIPKKYRHGAVVCGALLPPLQWRGPPIALTVPA